MLSIDLHRVKLETAMAIFTDHVNKARLTSTSYKVRFILGRGILYEAYLLLAKEYDLDVLKIGYGCIIINFE